MDIRRINFFGGACCGKSTIASYIFSQLKMNGISTGFAPEYVKEWSYLNRMGSGYDQLLIFANQLHNEELPLKSGESIIVSESPLLLACCYAKMLKCPVYKELIKMAERFEQDYPSLNIRLIRDGIEYTQEGRYGNINTATNMDKRVIKMLESKNIEYVEFNSIEPDKILDYILERL